MSGRGLEARSVEALVKQLEDYFCGSDELSIDALRYQVRLIPPNATAVQNSSFLHEACRNENVTLPIIECLLDAFPGAASVGSTLFRNVDYAHEQWATSYPLLWHAVITDVLIRLSGC